MLEKELQRLRGQLARAEERALQWEEANKMNLEVAVLEQQRLRGQLARAEERAVQAEERMREVEADKANVALDDIHQMLDLEAGQKTAKKMGKKKTKASKSKEKEEVEVQVPSPGLARRLELELKDEETFDLRDRLLAMDAMLMQERRESAELAKEVANEVRARAENEHQRLRGLLACAQEEVLEEQNKLRRLEKELAAALAVSVEVRVPGMGDAEMSALAEAVRAESSQRQRMLLEEEVRREMRAEREQERQAAAPPCTP
jgi:hypothetical protein